MARGKRTDADKAVWLRQPDESDKAFAAFQCFLELGDERTVVEVGRKLSKSRQLIDRWAQQFSWRIRAAAYDDYLATARAKKNRREMEERYTRFGKVSDVAYAHAAKYIKNINPATLTHKQAVELLMLSATLADRSKAALVQSEREAAEIEAIKRRLELEYLRLEAVHPATTPEEAASNFEEALRDTADEVWDYEQITRKDGEGDGNAD